jgi:hypothetical protein
MRLIEIPLADVFSSKNWVVHYRDDQDRHNPQVIERTDFGPDEYGLFAAMMRFADGSEHPALAVKSMQHGGEHTDTFVYTRIGWLNLLADGFNRAIGKYSHDVFPFDVFVANPWKGDTEIGAKADEHRSTFQGALPRLKALKYESYTGTRRRTLPSIPPAPSA